MMYDYNSVKSFWSKFFKDWQDDVKNFWKDYANQVEEFFKK